MPLYPAPWERVLSSDIKLYHNVEANGGATLVTNPTFVPDDWDGSETALEMMQAGDMSIIHSEPMPFDASESNEATIEFLDYTDTRIALEVESENAGFLVLADAWYPGWQATVNGEAVPVYRANVMFRAVQIPAGESEVNLRFESTLWQSALIIGIVVWLLSLGIGVVLWRRL